MMRIVIVPDHLLEEDRIFDRYALRTKYMTAVLQAGGLPLVVPYESCATASYLDFCHGLMLIGGGFTLDPRLFGQELATPLPMKRERSEAELAFFYEAFQRKMPILGICAGAQLINVALGGTLIQHLPTTHPYIPSHVHSDMSQQAHEVQIIAGTLLSSMMQGATTLGVNSSHVQAVDQLGRHVWVNARTSDGIIEGIEVEGHPFCLGVQWHPEFGSNPTYDRLLFHTFISYTKAYAQESI